MRVVHKTDGISYAVRQGGSAVGWCALTIRVGSRDEDGFHRGIAHFLEHTMFKGTSTKSSTAINSCLEKLGGELNAFTTKEEVVLHATTLKEDLPKAVSLLLEIAFDARFPEDEVEVEKGVVIDEIVSYKDSPSDDIYDVFEEKLFSGHPLASPILGTAESVAAIDSNELRVFHDRFFTPERMTLTIVSPFDEDKMLGMAEKQTSRWEKSFAGGTSTNNGAAKQAAREKRPLTIVEHGFRQTLDKDNHEANCILGNLAPDIYRSEDKLATAILCNMLGGPACNSILGYNLREKHGWVYNVECSYSPYSDSGIAAILFGCEKQNVSKCKKAIFRELRKLVEKPISEKRLEAAKKQILGQSAISMENGESQCISMGKALSTTGNVISDEKLIANVKAVTAEKIFEMAKEIFNPDKLNELTYL